MAYFLVAYCKRETLNSQYMKTMLVKILACLFLLFNSGYSSKAQITTPEGQLQGGSTKDTAHYKDSPSMHVHEQVTVIKREPVKNNSRAMKESGGEDKPKANDTVQLTGNTEAVRDTVAPISNSEISNPATSVPVATNVAENKNSNTLYAALTALGIGALIGLILIITIFRDRKTPVWLALVHGGLGLVGTGMLIAYAMIYPGPVIAIVLLAIAASGGMIVFTRDVRQETVPGWLALAHAVIAISGLTCLIVFALCR
jgi:hypothetical protein